MQSEPTVFVVDDDQAVRETMQRLLESVSLRAETYASGRAFLEACDRARPGCLVLDVRMPGMSGLELQERLAANGIGLPVIIITGHGDVPTARRALKAGAFDFLEKPLHYQELLDCVQQAIEQDAHTRRWRDECGDIAGRLALLTPRERQVMDLLVTGRTTKQIATQLGVSSQAIDGHRHKVLEKMRAGSLAELVRLALWTAAPREISNPRLGETNVRVGTTKSRLPVRHRSIKHKRCPPGGA